MTKLCFFSTSKWKEFQFGLDATPLYTPRQHPVFPLLYWTNISFSVIDRPYLFDDWCCEFLSHHQVVHERHFWMFLFGDRFFFRPQRVGLYKNFQTWRRFTPTCRCSQYIRGTSLISHATAACLFLGPVYMLLRWNSFETLFYQRTSIEQMDCVTQLKKSPIPTDEISNPNRTEFSTTTTDVK